MIFINLPKAQKFLSQIDSRYNIYSFSTESCHQFKSFDHILDHIENWKYTNENLKIHICAIFLKFDVQESYFQYKRLLKMYPNEIKWLYDNDVASVRVVIEVLLNYAVSDDELKKIINCIMKENY